MVGLRAGLTWAFGAGVALRARAYEQGWRPVHRAPGPVVSVGNLAMGGQGKTPVVALLAGRLADAGFRVAVVSRGYGRRSREPVVVSSGSGPLVTAEEGGDEPVMLARRTSAVVLADADRVRAAREAFSRWGADVVVLDDGFQHRRLHRDLDLVVLGESPPALFPRGRGREPAGALARAHLILATDPEVPLLQLRPAYRAPIVPVDHVDVAGRDARPLSSLRGRRVALLSGVARPGRFASTVRGLGAIIVHRAALPDHAPLSAADRSRFSRRARQAGAELELTTEKDACRWRDRAEGMRVVRVEVRLGIEAREALERELDEVLGGGRHALRSSTSPEPRPTSS